MPVTAKFIVCTDHKPEHMGKPYGTYTAYENVAPSDYSRIHGLQAGGYVDSVFVDGIDRHIDGYRNPIKWVYREDLLRAVKRYPIAYALINATPYQTPIVIYWD